MDIKILSHLLQQLIISNNKVLLPGLGSFIIEEVPSSLLNDGATITPPYSTIVFKNFEIHNDGILENAWVREANISNSASKKEINAIVAEIKKKLIADSKIEFPEFGTLRFNEGFQFVFVPHKTFFDDYNMFNSETITLERSDNSFVFSEKELAKGDDEVPFDVDGLKETPAPEETADGRVITDKVNDVEKSEETAAMFEVDNVEVQEGTEVVIEVKEVEVQEETTSAEVDYVEGKEETAAVPEVNDVEEPERTVAEQKIEEISDSNGADTKTTRVLKVIFIILAVIAVLFILATLVYIFKEPLKPWLEKIFYSKEEIGMLRSLGL